MIIRFGWFYKSINFTDSGNIIRDKGFKLGIKFNSLRAESLYTHLEQSFPFEIIPCDIFKQVSNFSRNVKIGINCRIILSSGSLILSIFITLCWSSHQWLEFCLGIGLLLRRWRMISFEKYLDSILTLKKYVLRRQLVLHLVQGLMEFLREFVKRIEVEIYTWTSFGNVDSFIVMVIFDFLGFFVVIIASAVIASSLLIFSKVIIIIIIMSLDVRLGENWKDGKRKYIASIKIGVFLITVHFLD